MRKIQIQNPYARQLTVSYMYQSGKFEVPFIRICGKWVNGWLWNGAKCVKKCVLPLSFRHRKCFAGI